MTEPARRQMVLAKRERQLSNALNHRRSAEKILRAAERVRAAKLSFFKGQREMAAYQEEDETVIRHRINIEQSIEEWTAMSTEDVVVAYQKLKT